MRTTSHARWILTGPIDHPEFEVVSITTTVESLAGPFKTKRQAEKWLQHFVGGGVQQLEGVR